MILRYYADADVREWHDYALRLLRTLYDEHGTAAEIDRIDKQHGSITDFPGNVHSSTPEKVCERDLKCDRASSQAINQTPSEALKRCGRLGIAGNVAVIDDERTIRWASALSDYTDNYRPGAASQTVMDFLKGVTTAPSNRICAECLSLLDGGENSCPSYGCESPQRSALLDRRRRTLVG